MRFPKGLDATDFIGALTMATIESIATEPPLRAVINNVPGFILDWRKTTGADQWDEMWEGVLHMAPSPNRQHQKFEFRLENWLESNWAIPNGCKVFHQINVSPGGTWTKNYRTPDLVLITPDRFHIDRNEYFEGAPAVVVEIHSPGDEAYEKLPFYAALGTPEVWIIDRDSKLPEIHVLEGGTYRLVEATADGWFHSPLTDAQMRVVNPGKLTLRVAGDEATRQELPDDA